MRKMAVEATVAMLRRFFFGGNPANIKPDATKAFGPAFGET